MASQEEIDKFCDDCVSMSIIEDNPMEIDLDHTIDAEMEKSIQEVEKDFEDPMGVGKVIYCNIEPTNSRGESSPGYAVVTNTGYVPISESDPRHPFYREPARPCRFFSSRRGCTKFSGCEFSHSQHMSSENHLPENKKCFFFNSPGGCRYGYNCRFKH